jgi:hypothetical protein
MWKRIGQVTVASVLFVAGSCSAGWIAAHSEYCQYGDYIGVGKCDAYVVATLVVDTITWSASATLPMLILAAAAAACLLSCSLHKSHDTLMQLVVVRGAQRNLRFTPVQHTTNIGSWRSLSGPKSEMIAHDTEPARARVVARSVELLELLGSEAMVSNGCFDKLAQQQPGRKALGKRPHAWRPWSTFGVELPPPGSNVRCTQERRESGHPVLRVWADSVEKSA